jgi:hypothetical protein
MRRLLPVLILLIIGYTVAAQNLIRGPYLMVGTSSSMVVRWRTDAPSASIVRYGATADALSQSVSDNILKTEHEVKLTGLSPKTKYYYSIGTSDKVLQGDSQNYFVTLPLAGERGRYRFGVFGDCGTNSAIQSKTRDQLNAYVGSNYLNAWLLLGDNAYNQGTETEYQSNFFNHYKDTFMKKSPLYPTPGNHDYHNDNFDRQNDHNVPYYTVFSMPTAAEAGGVASGTKAFYSYDYGNVHFLALDSYGREDYSTRLYDTLGKQVQWIKADLEANQNKDWIVAYWHHPPYSQGTRNGETDPEMTAIRQNFIRILERYGVDLIICGHSHVYERSRLMGGFYQSHNAFNPAIYNFSSSSGKYDGSEDSCPYIKEPGTKKGTVYVVSGSAGQLGGRSPEYPHKAMYYSNSEKGGAMLLEVEGNRLDAKWIGEDGEIRDKFTMEKDVNKTRSIVIDQASSVELVPSFVGNYVWSTGANSRSITVTPAVTTDYSVRDEFNCITDNFRVEVNAPLPVTLVSFGGEADAENRVTLRWVTENEGNLAQYSIERSLNGKDFTEIVRNSGTVGGGSRSTYEYTDETSSTIKDQDSLYYRLKIVEQDGKVALSPIRSIKIKRIGEKVEVEVAPNPASANDIQIRLVGWLKGEGTLMITDQSGKVHINRPVSLTDQFNSFLPSSMPGGIYILKVIIGGTSFVKKIVVL